MSSPNMYILDKAAETADLNGVEFSKPTDGYYNDYKRTLSMDGLSVSITLDRYSAKPQLRLPAITPEQIDPLRKLLAVVGKILKVYDKQTEADRKKAAEAAEARRIEYQKAEEERRARVEKEREEARKLAEIRAVKTKEREERLLNEFLGDTVRVRVQGFKSKVRATVKSREVRSFGDEEPHWQPYLEYHLDQNWHWPKTVDSVVSLEVRVGGRFEVVWNDLDDKPNEPVYKGVR